MALAQKIMDRLLELSTALHSCDPEQQRASLMGGGLGAGAGGNAPDTNKSFRTIPYLSRILFM